MIAIGEVARRTGIKIPTIRFYEQEGLLAPVARTESGRRLYSSQEVQRLAFIKHARTLGFELDDVRSLLDLSDHPERSCEDANRLARQHLGDVKTRMAQLAILAKELARVARVCGGGRAAECRVIEALTQTARLGRGVAAQPTQGRQTKGRIKRNRHT